MSESSASRPSNDPSADYASESGSHDIDEDFVVLLTKHQSCLRLYVRALMPGDSNFEDVVQSSNAKIWQQRRDFTTGTNFRAWMVTIARYEVLSFWKRRTRDARLCFSDELAATITDDFAEQQSDRLNDYRAALGKCLDKLSSPNRRLLMHRYGSNETLQSYADRCGRSVAGLKVTLHRLRRTLARCIDTQLETPR